VDTVPPSTVITAGPPADSNNDSASFSFTADEADVKFECSLDVAPFATCTSPKQYTGLADGSHTFQLRATDAAGSSDPEPPSSTWNVDTVAPDTTIDTGPQGASTLDSASFTFSSTETRATFECSLDGAAFGACTSPAEYTGLADGSHKFHVRAVDASGNIDASPAERDWVITTTVADTTPPQVTMTDPAEGALVHGSVTLSAAAVDNVAVDHVDFLVNGTVVASDGTAPYSVTWDSGTVADGSATISAVAVDTSSNAASSAARNVSIDNTAPDTAVDSGPQGAISSSSATFAFSSDDVAAGFECSLDGAAYAGCTSPQQYTGLADGSHTFNVRASDNAGNMDASPATRTWTADTVAPDTAITSGPTGAVVSRSATFSFSSGESGATFQCSLDTAAWADCPSSKQYTGLTDGDHTLQVRAKDAAGNIDASPAVRTWTVQPVAFADGFESGDFSNWTSVHTVVGGTAKVQSGTVKSGSYAAQITSASSTSYAYIRKTLDASQPDLTVSGDFNITTEGTSGQEVPIFKLYDSRSVRLLYVYRRNISGRIYVVHGGTTYPSTAKLPLGSWASFKVHAVTTGTGTSTVELTLNGVSIYSTNTASLGTSGIRTIQVGNDKQLPFALYADNIQARI
jgi:hypothetical protein